VLTQQGFQEVFLLFKRLAKLTHFHTEAQLAKDIACFAQEHGINGKGEILFGRTEFLNYLMGLGLEEVEAEDFWNAAYNQARFAGRRGEGEVVSMRAFAFNFRKFFLEELEGYRNCLSEVALRQRLVDLRLMLEPWFSRNIVFKHNHRQWKQQELELCAHLQTLG
jgi:hypothetical protein